MMRRGLGRGLLLLSVSLMPAFARAADANAVERGRAALLGRAFNPVIWSTKAYERAWRRWDGAQREAPRPYAEAFADHYGLHPAPYPNGDYPMGLRPVQGFFGAGLTTDCLTCHGGSILGRSYVGLGNAALDMQSLYEDLAAADGARPYTPFVFSNVRGTTEAGAMAVYLIGWRDPELNLRAPRLDLGLHADLCEDVPAWWLLKKKKTMYYTGSTDARSVRSMMQFMMSPLNSAAAIKREEHTFRDMQAYLLTLAPPKYPYPIDAGLAQQGAALFKDNCARCHGTYGANWTYPNKIVPLDVIGTDRARFDGLTKEAGRYYNRTWFGHEQSGWLADEHAAQETPGYQAPPLDGIWATAPYFHNGAAPTVYHVLNSKARPKVFTRSYRTDVSAYDPTRLGWKIEELSAVSAGRASAFEQRKIYDTTQPGRGNGGHRFGDALTEEERTAVIEYLKTL